MQISSNDSQQGHHPFSPQDFYTNQNTFCRCKNKALTFKKIFEPFVYKTSTNFHVPCAS